MYRYHASANAVLCAGITTGLVFTSLGMLPAWAAFLVGAGPIFILASIAHAIVESPVDSR
jgi:hypothetical protein